jgi:aspartate 1-decarboxylase
MCRAKIHRLTVTEADLDYEGSITIDQALLEAADIVPAEKVQVVNVNKGHRFETYVMSGKRNSGVVCLNGGAAHFGSPGDLVIVIAYAQVDEDSMAGFKPKIVLVNADNTVKAKI